MAYTKYMYPNNRVDEPAQHRDAAAMATTSSPVSETSSPASFYTANDSDTHQSTTASSPTQPSPCPYRAARQVPRALNEHCQIFLEEQLYTCAINLLNSVLGSGMSRRTPTSKPVPVPPPSHLALLGTLATHPLHTTRAEKPDHLIVSSLALDYLRSLLAIVGPINADFRTAFQFYSAPRWWRRPGPTGHGSDSDTSDRGSGHDRHRLRGRMANQASVWSRGQDLWSVVGWAFNTAALYPNRWRYWRAWLEFMLDALDADWNERERLDLEAHQASGKTGAVPVTSRKESMIYMYMDRQDSRQTGLKRILKALFADGGSLSSSAFPPVYEKELRGPRGTIKKRKREQALDLENDRFGDYFDDPISSGISEPPTPEKPRASREHASFGCSNPGLVESVMLRLRFFRLLSSATCALGKRSDLNQLYLDFVAGIKVLPLEMFSLFVSQKENPLLLETHITITKELFHLLLPSKHPDPEKVDPEGDAEGSLTMAMLEHCYMAFPANTVGLEDNAKLSLVVENAILLLWMCNMVAYTDSFGEAAKRGIKAREDKAKKRRTGKTRADAGDALAQDVLASSTERIRILIDALEASSDR